MQNSEHRASALFSDATTDELLQSSDGSLISEAMSRLGLHILNKNDTSIKFKKLTEGYMIAQKDRIIRNINGLSYGNPLGAEPKLIFNSMNSLKDIDDDSDEKVKQNTHNEEFDSNLVPIKTCRRYTF